MKCTEAGKKAQAERSIRKAQDEDIKRLEESVIEKQRIQEQCHSLKRALEAAQEEKTDLEHEKWEANEKAKKLSTALEVARTDLGHAESQDQCNKDRAQRLEEDIRSIQTRNEILRSNVAACELEVSSQPTLISCETCFSSLRISASLQLLCCR